jgi:eukaryotic-like serine/threonine-protein kinase
MRTRTWSIVWAACAAGCAAGSARMEGPTSLEEVKALPFRPLWNGRDLEGWVKVLDSDWVVEDGILLSRQDPAGRREGESWLITEKDHGDFALRVEFRVTPGGNSGVFLRDPIPRAERLQASDGGQAPWDAGFEAQINAEDPNYPTGSIWEIAKAPQGLHAPGSWTEMLILVRGDRVKTWVGGKPAVDARQERSTRGAIGLQRHGTPAYRDKVIEFRRVEIAEL